MNLSITNKIKEIVFHTPRIGKNLLINNIYRQFLSTARI